MPSAMQSSRRMTFLGKATPCASPARSTHERLRLSGAFTSVGKTGVVTILLFGLVVCCDAAALATHARFTPPIFNITARSLFDAGVQHGKMAKSSIQRWFAGTDVQELVRFVKDGGKGAEAYEALRRDSTSAFPLYAEELRGIAEGAEVPLDLAWTAILMIELQNLLYADTDPCDHDVGNRTCGVRSQQHCTDISAVGRGGFSSGFSHGHNEDWSEEVGPLYYYVSYKAEQGADFESCAGLAYPGSLIGWGPTWNAHGVFHTVNTLIPRKIRRSGISTSFIQRDAICGVGKGRNLAAVVEGLSDPRWADGASINVVDTAGHRIANVETYEKSHDSAQLPTDREGNMSHCNAYKRLPVDQWVCPSTGERQRLLDGRAGPRTAADVKSLLSVSPTLLRPITIATLVFDSQTGRIEAWGGTAPDSTPPLHSWHLASFFDNLTDDAAKSLI